jgi:hypothetical protein
MVYLTENLGNEHIALWLWTECVEFAFATSADPQRQGVAGLISQGV